MNIEYQQIKDLILGSDEAENYWVFENIIEGSKLYEGLRIEKERLVTIQDEVIEYLKIFEPSNVDVFDRLFSNWKRVKASCKVELVVGCPEIYDVMVRNNIIIIDIQNLDKYLSNGYSVSELLPLLITHEFVHLCINQDYQIPSNANYRDRLDYIIFQEGFAHAIPYIKAFKESNQSELNEYFNKSCERLEIAIIEEDKEKQKDLLIEADSGEYWDKFGAIASKLFILNNLDNIKRLYNHGPKDFHKLILEYYNR